MQLIISWSAADPDGPNYVPDPYFNWVSWLSLYEDDLTNIREAGYSVTTAAQNSAALSVAASKYGTKSLDLNGTNQSLSQSPVHAGGIWDPHQWPIMTVEAWIYIEVGSKNNSIIGKSQNGSAGFHFYVNSTNKLVFTQANGGASISSTGAVTVGQWVHVAVTKRLGIARLFIDGVLDTTAAFNTLVTQIYDPGYGVAVGAREGVGYYFDGFIDAIRFTKGICRYTETFTPPDKQFAIVSSDSVSDPYYFATVLHLHMEEENNSVHLIDSSPDRNSLVTRSGGINPRIYPAGNAKLSTAQKKFGNTSLAFDGTGDYVTIEHCNAIIFGYMNFTIEFWFRPSSVGAAQTIMAHRLSTDTTQLWAITMLSTGAIQIYLKLANAAVVDVSSVATLSANTWYHIAVVRNGASMKVFIDGTNNDTVTTNTLTSTTVWLANASIQTFLGVAHDGLNNPVNGYLDEFRLTKGIARYTANFTAPIAAFPDDISGGSAPTPSRFGDIALLSGGQASGTGLLQSYRFNIPVTSNSYGWASLITSRYGLGAASNGSRGVFGGGYKTVAPPGYKNELEYFTFASSGYANDFGDLTVARGAFDALSNGTRGVWIGGYDGTVNRNEMDYVTLATVGNATDFGDLTAVRQGMGAFSGETRGVFGGGFVATQVNIIEYITVGTAGNATDFGDVTVSRNSLRAAGNTTRAIFGGGNSGSVSNVLDYVTIATAGNATDFGDLTSARQGPAATSNETRSVWAGGYTTGQVDTIDYVTTATTGNAASFGNLGAGLYSAAICSGTV